MYVIMEVILLDNFSYIGIKWPLKNVWSNSMLYSSMGCLREKFGISSPTPEEWNAWLSWAGLEPITVNRVPVTPGASSVCTITRPSGRTERRKRWRFRILWIRIALQSIHSLYGRCCCEDVLSYRAYAGISRCPVHLNKLQLVQQSKAIYSVMNHAKGPWPQSSCKQKAWPLFSFILVRNVTLLWCWIVHYV